MWEFFIFSLSFSRTQYQICIIHFHLECKGSLLKVKKMFWAWSLGKLESNPALYFIFYGSMLFCLQTGIRQGVKELWCPMMADSCTSEIKENSRGSSHLGWKQWFWQNCFRILHVLSNPSNISMPLFHFSLINKSICIIICAILLFELWRRGFNLLKELNSFHKYL